MAVRTLIGAAIVGLLAAAPTVWFACSGSQGGAGQGEGRDAAVAARSIDDVLAASAGTRGRIPARLEGYRVVAEVTGPVSPR